MKAYILLGDNVFLERFNIVSPSSLYPHHIMEVYCLDTVTVSVNLFFMMFVTALQCHYEVHQSATTVAQRPHAQPHCERAELDGLSPGFFSWLTGQGACLKIYISFIIFKDASI